MASSRSASISSPMAVFISRVASLLPSGAISRVASLLPSGASLIASPPGSRRGSPPRRRP
ncbi:MAG: hypothetical protein E6Q57_02330 [Mycobacterium sp.]|nr:MAG: hypothetical protein E6Q57_02330 [Mycobacterium sp.]